MMSLAAAFKPDYEHYEGVRPIQILLLRIGYVLVLGFVGYRSWTGLLNHEGDWEPYMAAAMAMWASSSALSFIGIFRPLRMLPLVLFEIGYKSIWLIAVAWPLWSADRLAGTVAEGMTYAFLPVIGPILMVPWGYVFRTYVWSPSTRTPARAVTFAS
jgi:hypothetical protein